jgi:hypothetical protein
MDSSEIVADGVETATKLNWGEMIELAKHQFENLLNPSALTLDSIEGIITLLLILFLVKSIFEKSIKLISWCIAGILLIQIGYWLSFTGINDYIPLSSVFKYDILSSIAQLFVGTKVCDVILYINAFLKTVFTRGAELITPLIDPITTFFKEMLDMTMEESA